jgi:hypothetical protein
MDEDDTPADELPPQWNYWRKDYDWPSAEVKQKELEFHREPGGDSDDPWMEWMWRPSWTATQAAALTFGHDPEYVDKATIPADIPFWRFYNAVLRKIEEAQKAGELPDRIPARTFIEWAKRNNIDITPDLEEAVTWVECNIKELKGRIETLTARVEELTAQLDRAKEPTIDDLKPKELTTVYKLIYGMARIHYGYDPRRHVSPAKKIQGELKDKAGVTIDDDATVLKQLRKAAAHLDAAELLQ